LPLHDALPILRNQDAVLTGSTLQNFRITDALQSCVVGRREIDGGFTPPDGLDDSELEIVVSLEANTQGRDSLGVGWAERALARWIFSQSAGLACSNGIALPSNSRSVSSRYLSISA